MTAAGRAVAVWIDRLCDLCNPRGAAVDGVGRQAGSHGEGRPRDRIHVPSYVNLCGDEVANVVAAILLTRREVVGQLERWQCKRVLPRRSG